MKIKLAFVFFLILALNSCNGQDKKSSNRKTESKMIEKFDHEIYKKTNYGFESYQKEDGTIISMIDFDSEKGGVQKEIMPKPSFKTVYKEFYASGNIKKKEIFIGEKTKIDTSEYYDEKGNAEKVDENKKFGKVKPDNVLKFLEGKKVINLATGNGRFDENEQPTFEIEFEEDKKEYFITIVKGRPNSPPFEGMGEPSAFLPIIYKMDGETGKVEEIK